MTAENRKAAGQRIVPFLYLAASFNQQSHRRYPQIVGAPGGLTSWARKTKTRFPTPSGRPARAAVPWPGAFFFHTEEGERSNPCRRSSSGRRSRAPLTRPAAPRAPQQGQGETGWVSPAGAVACLSLPTPAQAPRGLSGAERPAVGYQARGRICAGRIYI